MPHVKSKKKLKQREDPRRKSSVWRPSVGWLVLLLLLNLLAYSNSFHADWHFDDLSNIVNNRDIQMRTLSWTTIERAWSSRVAGMRPLAYLSFALNYYASGLDVFTYHLVNFALHIGNAFLVFILAIQLSRRSHPDISEEKRRLYAFLAASLWSLSPVQTQAVTYIVQRMSVLAAFFMLLSLVCYIRARSVVLNHWHRWLEFAGAAGFAFLAFVSKENSFMLPALVIAFEFIFARENSPRNKKLFLIGVLATFVFASAVMHHLRVLDRLQTDYQGRDFTLKQRLLTESRIVTTYLTQLALPLPSRLALHHEVDISNTLWSPPTTLLSIFVHAGFLLIAWRFRRNAPLIAFSIVWFYLNHLIESSVFPLELMFEHRSYLPSVGFFLVAATPLLTMEKRQRSKKWRVLLLSISAVFVLGSLLLAFHRNKAWQNELTLWKDNLEKYPNSFRVHDNLGTAYAQSGNDFLAEIAFRESLRLNPKFPGARINLALLALRAEKTTEALRWVEGLDDQNLNAGYSYNLGVIYAGCGQLAKAAGYYSRAIAKDAYYAEAYYNLGLVQANMGNKVEARKNFSAFLQNWNGDPSDVFVIKAQSYIK